MIPSYSDLPDPEIVARPDFSTVPALIREHGRSRGFERLRDLVLERPEALGAESFLPVLKLVIELDRHALFSEVSEAKARDHMDRDAWDKFQEYLQGDEVAIAEKPKKGKKRGKVKQTPSPKQARVRSPLRETDGIIAALRGTDRPGTGHEGSEARPAGSAEEVK